jgi:hypothetical protein
LAFEKIVNLFHAMPQRLAVQGPNGRFQLELSPSSSISELKTKIMERTSVIERRQKLLYGFPPKELVAASDCAIEKAGLSNGDMIRVSEFTQEEMPSRVFERK